MLWLSSDEKSEYSTSYYDKFVYEIINECKSVFIVNKAQVMTTKTESNTKPSRIG